MAGIEKTTNFAVSFLIYSLLSIIVIVAGLKAIRYSNHLKFYSNYLLGWERALVQLSSKDVLMPSFNGNNHVEYMNSFVRALKNQQIQIPDSNTPRPYVYKISGQATWDDQMIFLLCFEKKIVLFGLSKTTFNMLDKNIDGELGTTSGKFTGKKQKNHATHTGIWTL